MKISQHPLITTLRNLRGNPKACVLTEPMWGIPYYLYNPYVSIYMLALGLKDSQIGLLLSLNMAFQIVACIFSGPITDKLGRRKATFVMDIIYWGIPTFVWGFAQNITYFIIAAVFNGLGRVAQTSWTCLLVEDADQKQMVDIYSWITIAGLLAAFFAPIAGALIQRFTLVPTMRGLYIFAGVMMMAKATVLYLFSTETQQGIARMEETRSQSIFSMLGSYSDVLKLMFHSPKMMFTLGIMLVLSAATTINSTFWSIIVTQRMHIPDSAVALFPFARSIAMLFFFFLAMPRIRELKFRNPMMIGFIGLALSQLILILIPEKNYILLLVSTIIEGCSYATASTQTDRMTAVTVDPQERARIMGMLYLASIIITTPFGWIAGLLSTLNRTLPFALDIALYLTGVVLVYFADRYTHPSQKIKENMPVEGD
jgi:MFS family permease